MTSSRLRILLLSVFAVFAVSAVASASSASAIGWTHCVKVEGEGKEPPTKFDNEKCNSKEKPLAERKWEDAELKAGETLEFSEFEAGAVKASRIKLAGITIECAKTSFGAEPTGDFIIGTNGGSIKAGGLKFEECKVTKPAGCKITAETITTKDAIELVLNNTSTEVTFKIKAGGTVFAAFKFANEAGCGVLKGKTVEVTGETKGTISNPAACEEKHVLSIAENTTATNKLKAAGTNVEEFDQEITLPGVENLNGTGSEPDMCWDA